VLRRQRHRPRPNLTRLTRNGEGPAAWLGAWGSFLGGLAALGALGLAARQLKGLVKQLKQSNFTAFLTLEIEMNSRKQKVDEACREVRRLAQKGATSEEIVIANDFVEVCVENWLNLFDRLAFCILKKYLRENDFKTEYRKYLQSLVDCNPQYLQEDTVYDNILVLCHRWHIVVPKVAVPESSTCE
jgi:ribosomal protein L31E